MKPSTARPRAARISTLLASSLALATLAAPRVARADDATVTVGAVDAARFAAPPRDERWQEPARPIVVDASGYVVEAPPERERAPVRLGVGPAAITSGRGLGLGLGVSADFGTGTVGARIAAAWLRGEARGDDEARTSPLGSGVGQYTGELTLDLHKRGPIHPILGAGFGLVHVSKPGGGGNAGVGTGRLALEYQIALEDADVRLGAGITGVIAGPTDREVDDLHGYALVGAALTIGF